MSKQTSTALASKEWFLNANWVIEKGSNDQYFLLAAGDGGTVTFVPIWPTRDRKVHGWQHLDGRLPQGANLMNVEDQEIIGVLNRAWELAWAERDQQNAEKAAERDARALDDDDIRAAIAGVGATRLMRIVIGKIDSPQTYRTFDPARFDLSQLRPGEFAAGIVYLAVDSQGNRIGRKVFRNTDDFLAHKALQAAEQVAARKCSRLNRTEQLLSIKDGSFFG